MDVTVNFTPLELDALIESINMALDYDVEYDILTVESVKRFANLRDRLTVILLKAASEL